VFFCFDVVGFVCSEGHAACKLCALAIYTTSILKGTWSNQ